MSAGIRQLKYPLAEKDGGGWRRYPLFKGATRAVEAMSCHAAVLSPGHSPHLPSQMNRNNLLWIAGLLLVRWVVAALTKFVVGAVLHLLWIVALLLGSIGLGFVLALCVARIVARHEALRTVFRETLAPSPYFEGCNLLFPRAVLERTGGFDESYHFGGEDTWRETSRQLLAWGRKNLPPAALDGLTTSYDGVVALHRMMATGMTVCRKVRNRQ